MRNRKDIKTVLEHCIEQRRVLPEISKLDNNNWEELDEQILMLKHCLDNGVVPYLDDFLEDETNKGVLWVLELNSFYDCVINEKGE
jgi:hypothetical protein